MFCIKLLTLGNLCSWRACGLMDSVLVANEVKRRKSSYIFFKVDYEKAYDSVIWEFIYYM